MSAQDRESVSLGKVISRIADLLTSGARQVGKKAGNNEAAAVTASLHRWSRERNAPASIPLSPLERSLERDSTLLSKTVTSGKREKGRHAHTIGQ